MSLNFDLIFGFKIAFSWDFDSCRIVISGQLTSLLRMMTVYKFPDGQVPVCDEIDLAKAKVHLDRYNDQSWNQQMSSRHGAVRTTLFLESNSLKLIQEVLREIEVLDMDWIMKTLVLTPFLLNEPTVENRPSRLGPEDIHSLAENFQSHRVWRSNHLHLTIIRWFRSVSFTLSSLTSAAWCYQLPNSSYLLFSEFFSDGVTSALSSFVISTPFRWTVKWRMFCVSMCYTLIYLFWTSFPLLL